MEQMKNELVGKIMTKFVVLTLKTYNYLKQGAKNCLKSLKIAKTV